MHISTFVLLPQHSVLGLLSCPITGMDPARLLIGDVAAGSFLYNFRDQSQVLRSVLASGTGTGNGRTGAPLLGAGARIRFIPASWLDVTVTARRSRVWGTMCRTLKRQVQRLLDSYETFHSSLIYSNGTTPCPNLAWPAQVKVGMGVGPYASPSHEAFRCHIKSSSE
jgi:hypothetical protein